ncbi:uncharacterized protein TRAVEDRAFT_57115 [Trametes versicolor FP-101664 SS1]|uniref:uncharacterized protein n=1 Tax=Trametes versicolor (strain FP-101664) TaxID=717944 RepID=UPI0004621360|nr:uncharacterized protein TRAVEDRAFT_57115 [Trametes versicolor FP-101664 SS1]EIW61971.1 hypothetical protein TRAVEDRAFT_57115 [Trametes versicolor FP-101664 SS1]
MSTPAFLPQDIQNPLAAEFLRHPDFRATAGFLLGWVFWCSVSYAYRSQFFQLLGHICWNFIRRTSARTQTADVEARTSANLEKYSRREEGRLAGIQNISNEAALVFTLNLCFVFASFAEFCSILAYDPGGADTACAFTVAWANMAAQAARLIGLAVLVLHLKQRSTTNVEFYCLCTALVIALSFILAFNATNTGDMVFIQTLGIAMCVKIQFLPTALLTSIGFILLELYVAIRCLAWENRKYGWRVMVSQSANLQVARAVSLLLIDILTFAPNVIRLNVLGQFIPFSLGALIVLMAFNYKVDSLVAQDQDAEPILPTSRVPTPLPVTQLSRQVSPVTVRSSPVGSPNRGAAVLGSPGPSRPPRGYNKPLPPVTAPYSAPPRIGDTPMFADLQARQILPFQVKYVEQLEEQLQRHIHTGPIVPRHPKRQRPHVQVVIEDMEAARLSIIGSDIVRLSSAKTPSRRERRDTKDTKIWSPSTTATPSDYTVSQSSSDATPTARYSNQSTSTFAFNRTTSSSSRQKVSSMLSRQGSRNLRSPGETSLKLPWRSAPRQSFASGRTFGGRDELPPVAEANAETSSAGLKTGSWRGSQSSAAAKRLVISRPHSLRASRPSSPLPSRLGLQLPGLPSSPRPVSAQHLTVPDRVRTPTTPDTPSSSMRGSPGHGVPTPLSPPLTSHERAQGSGRLRGPRSPPMSGSSPNLRSAWPTTADGVEAQDFTPGHTRRRSGSCPELPPLDLGANNLRSHPSTKRQRP